MPKAWPESKFTRETLDWLKQHKWMPFHDFAVNFAHMNLPGFPDIVSLWCDDPSAMSLVAELKEQDDGEVSEEQHAWLFRFHRCGFNTFVWRPEHWDMMLNVIQSHQPPPYCVANGWYELCEGTGRKVSNVMSIHDILAKQEEKRLKARAKKRAQRARKPKQVRLR